MGNTRETVIRCFAEFGKQQIPDHKANLFCWRTYSRSVMPITRRCDLTSFMVDQPDECSNAADCAEHARQADAPTARILPCRTRLETVPCVLRGLGCDAETFRLNAWRAQAFWG